MLYIMRHGRTDWNDLKKMQGRTDIPLNEAGIKMAQKAAEEYVGIHFDVCYCSPLTRAKETAELLLKNREVPIIFDDRLIEMSFGSFEGSTGFGENEGSPIYTFFKHPEEYEAAEGAESFEELFARTGEFLKEVALPLVDEGKDVLIVGHGAMNSSIVCQVRDLPIKEFWSAGIENCKLMKLI
ncbi:MAG: histidine phosphatase family protein [Pseudobutyrivibrio sp.]|nr:histidine phosphatase family protein [Pseudobutyrivibrio sp.]